MTVFALVPPASNSQAVVENVNDDGEGDLDGESTPPRVYKRPYVLVAGATITGATITVASAMAAAAEHAVGVVAEGSALNPASTAGESKDSADSGTAVYTKAPELLLLAAPPACGKSTLARRLDLGGYVRVNQDTLGSFDRCVAAARNALLQERRSVCVDNTNMDVNTRQKWVQLAKQWGVQVRFQSW
jgi:hypothetical protein